MFVATNTVGVALAMTGGSVNLAVASTTLRGGPSGRGFLLGLSNSGVVTIGSVTVTGTARGIEISTQSTGFSLVFDSVTFRGLSVGATAIHFLGGTPVTTFTLANFEDASVGVNVSAVALDPTSRIFMNAHSGARTNVLYENDPANVVDWEDSPKYAGCTATKNVGAGQAYSTIQAAVNSLPKTLAGRSCVVIRDGATYPEQVTVQGFINNGSSITIFADPASGLTPGVSPPATSTAAFLIVNASVSITGIRVSPTAGITYGIYVSSPYVTISSVSVLDPISLITDAGIWASSWTTVSYTSVSVTHTNAAALWLQDSTMATVAYSTAVNNSAPSAAVHLVNANNNAFTVLFASNTWGWGLVAQNSDSNTVTQSYLWGGDRGAVLTAGADYNAFSFSTMFGIGNTGLQVSGSSLNTVTQSYLSGGQIAVYLVNGSDLNTISFSTMVSNNAGTPALDIYHASSNTILNSYVQGSTAAWITGSTGTMIGGSMLVATNAAGAALALTDGSVNLSLSSVLSAPWARSTANLSIST